MAKKKKTELNITASPGTEEETLDITINQETITCKVYQSGTVKFSYVHPDIGKSMKYEGIIEGTNLYLYPMVGTGVLTTRPVAIN